MNLHIINSLNLKNLPCSKCITYPVCKAQVLEGRIVVAFQSGYGVGYTLRISTFFDVYEYIIRDKCSLLKNYVERKSSRYIRHFQYVHVVSCIMEKAFK